MELLQASKLSQMSTAPSLLFLTQVICLYFLHNLQRESRPLPLCYRRHACRVRWPLRGHQDVLFILAEQGSTT